MPIDRALRIRLLRLLVLLMRLPVLVLATIYFLLDEVVPAILRPLYVRLAALRPIERLGTAILALPPTATLILFLVPFAVLEPVKLFALVLLAGGHFATGGMLLAGAHLASIVLVERLFRLTRPKLLEIAWFARVHGVVVGVYDWSLGRLKATAAWRRATAMLTAVRRELAAVAAWSRRSLIAPLRRFVGTLRRPRRG